LKKTTKEQILVNFQCTDIYSQYNRLNKKDIYDVLDQLKDKFDNVSLKKINDKYFEDFPLMIQEITAVPYENIKF